MLVIGGGSGGDGEALARRHRGAGPAWPAGLSVHILTGFRNRVRALPECARLEAPGPRREPAAPAGPPRQG